MTQLNILSKVMLFVSLFSFSLSSIVGQTSPCIEEQLSLDAVQNKRPSSHQQEVNVLPLENMQSQPSSYLSSLSHIASSALDSMAKAVLKGYGIYTVVALPIVTALETIQANAPSTALMPMSEMDLLTKENCLTHFYDSKHCDKLLGNIESQYSSISARYAFLPQLSYIEMEAKTENVLKLYRTAKHKNFSNIKNNSKDNKSYLMGIETETGSITFRTSSTGYFNKDIFSIFLKEKNSELPFIKFTYDTINDVIKNNENKQRTYRNIEIKSVGGLTYEEVLKASSMTQKIFNTVISDYNKSNKDTLSKDEGDLRVTAKNPILQDDNTYKIKYDRSSQTSTAYYEVGKQVDYFLRYTEGKAFAPKIQLTFQLPLNQVYDFITNYFKRAYLPETDNFKIREHPKLNYFFVKSVKDETSIEKSNYNSIGYLNSKRINRLEAFDAYNQLKNIQNKNFQGLKTLFFIYEHLLFNNRKDKDNLITNKKWSLKEVLKLNEAKPGEGGIKPQLPVMSRISFSDMYKTLLNDSEKNQFNEYCDSLKDKTLHLMTYINDDGLVFNENNPSLFEWCQSIINPTMRIVDGIEYKTDLLSPLYNNHSPGIMKLQDSDSNALLELRGFSNIKELETKNIEKSIDLEAKWFFKVFDKTNLEGNRRVESGNRRLELLKAQLGKDTLS